MTHTRRVATRQIQLYTKIRLQRRLPRSGKILLKKGQQVSQADVIGQVILPDRLTVVDVASALGIQNLNLDEVMLKGVNEQVEEGEVIAKREGRFSFLTRLCKSPVKGRISAFVKHWALIETETQVERVTSLISGQIAAVDHTRGVVIETSGTYIEAACSLGGEAYGELIASSDDPRANLTQDAFDVLSRQAVYMAGGSVDEETIRRAEELGVIGLIVGSFDASLLALDPPPSIPVAATEGFGNRTMAPATFEMLRARLNDDVSIHSAKAGAKRPLIIIPGSPPSDSAVAPEEAAPPTGFVAMQSLVRNSRDPRSLAWGEISAIPQGACDTEPDIKYRGAEATFADGVKFVPWLNLEHLGDL